MFIAPNEVKALKIHFLTNNGDGEYYGSLKITNPCGKNKTLILKGGIFKPDMQLPDTLDFGDVCLNSISTSTFPMMNKSSKPTYFSAMVNANSSFTFTQDSLSKFYGVNEQREVPVQYKSGAIEGVYYDSMKVVNICGISKTLILKATAFNPNLSNPAEIDLGRICINNIKDTTITLNNLTAYNSRFIVNPTDSTRYSTNKPLLTIPGSGQQQLTLQFKGYNSESSLVDTLHIIDRCGIFHNVVLKANIINPKLISDSTTIYIDSVEFSFSKTRKVTYRNNGVASYTLDNVNTLNSPFKVISVTPPLPVILNLGDSIVVEFEFTGLDDLVHNQNLILSGSFPCYFGDTISITAQGLPAVAKAIVSMHSDSAYAGETVNLPLMLKASQNIIESGINSFTAKIRFYKNMLKPAQSVISESIVGDFRIIEVTGPVTDSIGKLMDLKFTAFMTDTDCTELMVDTIIWTGGKRHSYTSQNGVFCLKGICRKGGATRYISTNAKFSLNDAKPNPVSHNVTFNFDLNEDTQVKLNIIDVLGRNNIIVLDEFLKMGTYSLNFNISNLSDGIYIL